MTGLCLWNVWLTPWIWWNNEMVKYCGKERKAERWRNKFIPFWWKTVPVCSAKWQDFFPEDVFIFKDSPKDRRNFMDRQLSLLFPLYVKQSINYKETLESRNNLLKNKRHEKNSDDPIDHLRHQLRTGTECPKRRETWPNHYREPAVEDDSCQQEVRHYSHTHQLLPYSYETGCFGIKTACLVFKKDLLVTVLCKKMWDSDDLSDIWRNFAPDYKD